ncbi:MAG: hypothetical protein WCE81_13300 [Halobacteriota archaeon]
MFDYPGVILIFPTYIRRVQLLRGHRSIATTQAYLQFDDTDVRAAYDTVAFKFYLCTSGTPQA